MTRNMTAGSPAKLIVMFTIPLIIGNVFQQFYSMADTLIVGRTIGVNALAAVGCTGSITFFILGFVMGLTSGLTIITAEIWGSDLEVSEKFCGFHFDQAFAVTVISYSRICGRSPQGCFTAEYSGGDH